MKYAIYKCTDGNFAVHGEYPDPKPAKVAFHLLSAALWNDAATTRAKIMIVDENLITVDGCYEDINKTAEATNEPE